MTMKVGFIGLGAMGLPLAKNLQRKGFAVNGYDIDPTKYAYLGQIVGVPATVAVPAGATRLWTIRKSSRGDPRHARTSSVGATR